MHLAKVLNRGIIEIGYGKKAEHYTLYYSFLFFIDAMVAMQIGLMPFSRSLRYDFPRGDPKKASIATTGRPNDSANV